MKRRPRRFADRAGRAGAAERVEHEVVGPRGCENHPRQQRLGLLRRMQLPAVAALEAFLAGAERQDPIRAHLHIVVAGFERFVVESVALAARFACRPDQGLVRVGKTAPAKVRHGIRFAPHDVIEDPKAQILQDRPDAEDIVVRPDHPERRRALHDAPAGDQPGAGKIVVGGKARELVPGVVDRVDARIVRTLEVALQLQVIGRVGKNEVDRFRRQRCHLGNAVTDQNSAALERLRTDAGRPIGRPATRCYHDSGLLTQATRPVTRDLQPTRRTMGAQSKNRLNRASPVLGKMCPATILTKAR